LRNIMGLILHPKIRENWENTLNHARAQLDEDAFTAAWDRGHYLVEKGWEYVIAYAMGEVGEE
ncbi:MAG TPA: hypothetical protein VFO91_13305, partial [Anaerolineales bacterium]|nr:hypothetical protein [Anaerolineales bacterium]